MPDPNHIVLSELLAHKAVLSPELGGRAICRPASIEEVESAERKMGVTLPPLLKSIYTQVANGGFGPGYGLLGVAKGAVNHDGLNLEGFYLAQTSGALQVQVVGWWVALFISESYASVYQIHPLCEHWRKHD